MVQKLTSSDSRKKVVGLTGIFGSGKSSVAKVFAELGAFVIDTDELSHEALHEKATTYPAVRELFPEAVDHSGALVRQEIAKVVFSDGDKRKRLEAIVHPFVLERLYEEVAASNASVIVVEVPLLFEAGFDACCDVIVVVETSKEQIFERLGKKGFNQADIQKRLDSQMQLEEKVNKADYVIHNSSTLNETKREVEQIWKQIESTLKGEK